LFRSERLGRGGRRFACLKFRTMCTDAQERLLRILGEDENASREYAASFKLRHDPRATRAGAWLRRTSLDELPQLWNVLRGEMSLVGPRPIMPAEIEKYDTDRTNYFRVKCGLTGLWQTSGRSDLDYAERVRLDVFYIRNWNVWLDLVILARTAVQVLRPKGAY
jgi:undecaprenyl-phosphate galactose phosphotransferase